MEMAGQEDDRYVSIGMYVRWTGPLEDTLARPGVERRHVAALTALSGVAVGHASRL